MTTTAQPDSYTLGYGDSAMDWMTKRTAKGHAAFLLPYLKPGMSLLDVGCGPGTVTVGFARELAPGKVVGVDQSAEQFAPMLAHAAEEGLVNLTLEEQDIYALPYPDESFDVVFCSAVLGSVKDAPAVVAEMNRVLKPGGFMAMKEFDHGGDIIYPLNPTLERSIELYIGIREENGHEPAAGRKLKEYIHNQGLEVKFTHVFFDQQLREEQLVPYIERNNGLFFEVLGPQYFEKGWCTPEELQEHAEAWLEFARDPSAIYCAAWVEALGRKPGELKLEKSEPDTIPWDPA